MIRFDLTVIKPFILKYPNTIEKDRITLIQIARAAKLLAMADKYDHGKANYIERVANRFDKFSQIAKQEKMYFKDFIQIISLVIQELADNASQSYQSIAWDVEFIKHYIQANDHVFQNDDIIA
jgi:hypothetical protein